MTRWLAGIWLAAIAALSMVPLSIKYRLGTVGPLHSWGHLLAFFIAALLFRWERPARTSPHITLVTLLVLAFTLEYLEVVVYHSHFEWKDVVMDAAGALAGLFASAIRNAPVSD